MFHLWVLFSPTTVDVEFNEKRENETSAVTKLSKRKM